MCDLRKLSVILGVVFLVVGISSYMPFMMKGGSLLGIFEASYTHSLMFIASGVIGLVAASKESYARLFLKVFGIFYGIIAVVGFARSGNLYYMHVNMADSVLHLVIAFVALYSGFWCKKAD